MSASVYECVHSRPYMVSAECHLMKTGFRMNWLPVVKKRTSGRPITDCGCVVDPETIQKRNRENCRIGEIFSLCVNCRRYFHLLGSLRCGPYQADKR